MSREYSPYRYIANSNTSPELHVLSYNSQNKAVMIVLLTYSMQQSPSWEANWFCS